MPSRLSSEEVAALLEEAGLDAAAASAIAFALNEAAGPIVDRFIENHVASLGMNVTAETLERARALYEVQARGMLRDLASSEINRLGKTIADGLADGLGPDAIARRIKDAVPGLSAVGDARLAKYEKFLRDSGTPDALIGQALQDMTDAELAKRRMSIARTETARAMSDGDRLIAEGDGAQFKAWVTSGDDRVSDECQANEADGWIALDEEFSGGVQNPPQHPNCRCAVTYRSFPPSREAMERAEERAAKTEAAKTDDGEG